MKTLALITESSPDVAARQIRKAVESALPVSDGIKPKWIEQIDVTEGAEKCGYGKLYVSGLVKSYNGFGAGFTLWRLDSGSSQWKKYGHPSGTKYVIEISLTPLESSETMLKK